MMTANFIKSIFGATLVIELCEFMLYYVFGPLQILIQNATMISSAIKQAKIFQINFQYTVRYDNSCKSVSAHFSLCVKPDSLMMEKLLSSPLFGNSVVSNSISYGSIFNLIITAKSSALLMMPI